MSRTQLRGDATAMPEFELLTKKRDIDRAERLLQSRLKGAADETVSARFGHQGGGDELEVYWTSKDRFWYGYDLLERRWWNAFGLDRPSEGAMLTLTVEINPPTAGVDRRLGGAFLRDASGRIYIAHTGKVGGGRRGIGKRQFMAFFEGATITVDDAEYILIGAIDADDFTAKLGDFIRTVDRFKREVSGTSRSSESARASTAPSYWKIAAEAGASEWPAWRAGNHVAIGWNELGDLTGADRAEFERRVRGVLKANPDWKSARLEQVWRFSTQIQEGARVVVNRGTTRVVAIGTVTGPYRFVRGVSHGHRLPVRWDDVEERLVERGGWRKTLIQLKREDFEEILAAPRVDDEVAEEAVDLDAEPDERLNFDDLMARLRDRELRFDDEALASYLLALQTKRFVILSGISGTGKTAMALEVARSLAPSRHEVSPQRERLRVQVMPYMVKYRRLALPKALAEELEAIEALRGDKLAVYFGEVDEEEPCQLRVSTGNGARIVNFRGDFRRWFDETFDVGDELALSVYFDELESPWLVVNAIEGEDTAAEVDERGATYRSVAVRPDWTDNRGLLGYYNPITSNYQTTPFLELLLAAAREAERASEERRAAEPYFVILDEMNLARVEHYFSDFLSSMESGEPLHLHDDPRLAEGLSETGEVIPRELTIPRNLFFTGTVNVDETTYMFSPKVLDRAFVLEFNTVDLRGYGAPSGEQEQEIEEASGLRLDGFDGRLGFRGRGGHPNAEGARADLHRPGSRDWEQLRELAGGVFVETLAQLNELLALDHRHFGYRVANEISRFMLIAANQAGDDDESLRAAFDVAVLAKVLPKLHGTEQELRAPLEKLFSFAVSAKKGAPANAAEWTLDSGQLRRNGRGEGPALRLPRTAAKLWRMLRRLRERGFVSFVE